MSLNATNALELSVDGYATFATIQGLIPWRTLSSSSTPTRAQAAGIVRNLYQDINTLLYTLGYKIPVSSGNATTIRFLGRFNALGAAAEIEQAAYSAGNTEASDHADRLWKRYDQTYKMLEKGALTLNATQQSNYIHTRSQRRVTYKFHSVGGTEQETKFTKNMDW